MRNIANYIILAVAICTTLLQPFLHIHLDKDHPIQQTGFHIANAYEEINAHAAYIGDHVLASTSHASEIISIDAAFKKDIDLNLSENAFILALIIFCISLSAPTFTKSAAFQPNLYRFYKRRLPASRAPPQH